MNKAVKRAYTAGLIDGEGTITIDKRLRPSGVAWYQVHIRVAMTKNAPLKKMVAWWSGHVNETPYKHADNNNGKWSDYYAWQLWTKQAVDFLTKIEPYLILKKENARIAIQFQKRVNGYKHTGFGRRSLSKEELALREELYQQMKALNHRGLHLQRLSEEDIDGISINVCDSPILREEQLEVVVPAGLC